MTNAKTTRTEAVIVASVRTAVGKAPKGALRLTRPDDIPPPWSRPPCCGSRP